MKLTKEQWSILDHTLHRAANRRYCGDSPAMEGLVRRGLMTCLGKASWCPDKFFTITGAGREAHRQKEIVLACGCGDAVESDGGELCTACLDEKVSRDAVLPIIEGLAQGGQPGGSEA